MANEKSVMAVIRASRPDFRNSQDKLAFSVHASFLASGYILTATGQAAFSDNALSSSSSTDEVGVDGWNEHEGEYAFVYVNPENNKSKKVLVKCLAMNGKLLVDAVADSGAEPVHIEFDVNDYVREDGGANYSDQFKNLDKLVGSLKKEILDNLDGKPEPSSSSSRPSSETSEETRRNMIELGFRDQDPSGPQAHPSGVILPPVYPLGQSDLVPGPAAGVFPSRDRFGDGCNLLGPNDPRWLGEFGSRPGFPAPETGVPPGARFDPYGPPGVPGFEPGRFTRNPRRPGSGTHPDLEHFGDGSDFI